MWNYRTGLLVVVFFVNSLFASSQHLVSADYDDALYKSLDLKIYTARKIIQKEYRTDEYIYWQFLENWNELIELVVTEDKENYELFIDRFKDRYEKLKDNEDELKKQESYYALMAEMNVHAGLAQIIFGDYFSGVKKVFKAKKYIDKSLEHYPDFWYMDKLRGIMNVSFDKMPRVFQWFSSLFGIKGDADLGFKLLNRYLEKTTDYKGLNSEAQLYLGFAYKMYKDDHTIYDIWKKQDLKYDEPTILIYLKTNILIRTQHNEEALELLNSWSESDVELPFIHMSYLKGKANLYRLSESAGHFFEDYLANSTTDNFKREVYLLLAHNALMHNKTKAYENYLVGLRNCPKATTNRDREADVEMARPYPPHVGLLKCRYLVTGGYYTKARDMLFMMNPDQFEEKAYQVEYHLLKGMSYAGLEKYEEATFAFEKAISMGKEMDEHYAAQAAWLAGNMELKRGNPEKAKTYWTLAKKIKGSKDVYFEIIHRKVDINLKRTP